MAVEGKKGDKLRFRPGQTPLSFLPPPPLSPFSSGKEEEEKSEACVFSLNQDTKFATSRRNK